MFSHCNEVLISILYQSQPFYHCALAEIEQLGQVRSCDFYRSTPPFSWQYFCCRLYFSPKK